MRKGAEDAVELVRGNAAPRVMHPECKADLAVLAADAAHADFHLAAIGELDGVADQVVEDLAQAGRIAAQHGGHSRLDVVEQLDALLACTQRKRATGLGNHRDDREINALERQMPGLYAREIEDVVDDGEQRLGR